MKPNKTHLLLTSLIASPLAFASSGTNFSNPNEHYSRLDLGYGNNGFDVAVQYTKPMNNSLTLLSSYRAACVNSFTE